MIVSNGMKAAEELRKAFDPTLPHVGIDGAVQRPLHPVLARYYSKVNEAKSSVKRRLDADEVYQDYS